jgi:alpha-galactosidase
MSQLFHEVIRDRVCRGVYRNAPRPVLVNNWEATYFDFTEQKLLELAATAATCGIELFVLDDGWFGERNDDTTSLGDWSVQQKKFPNGLRQFGEELEQKGLQFGLWVEPEMVSQRSALFERHPEWCFSVPGRERSESRNQLVLNMALPEVVDHLYEVLSGILRSAPIRYIKWDMNRHLTEVYSPTHAPDQQGEIAHRYVLGVYDLLHRLTHEFQDVLFEGCSGGGGRFDAGMLYYTPQIWTSDNTDGAARLQIQHGTSLFYPPSTMGAHVSAVPNHQVGRTTSLTFRGHIATAGVLGYELDLTKLLPEELQDIAQQVHQYKGLRSLVQSGTFSRLRSPFDGNDTAWQIQSPSGDSVLVMYARLLAIANERHDTLRLVGLTPEARYHWNGTNRSFGGDELLYHGIPLPSCHHDFVSHLILLTREQ